MFAPEILADERDVRLHFLLRQKRAAEDRMDAESVEIVRGRMGAKQLHRIAYAREDVARSRVRGETREDGLAIAKVPEARDAHRQLREISLFRFGLENNEPIRVLEWKPFQEEVVDQTEDRSVHPDAEREGQYGERGERGRFKELAESEAEVDHGDFRFWIFDFRLREFIPRGR